MRAVVQRVSQAQVVVDGEIVGQISRGSGNTGLIVGVGMPGNAVVLWFSKSP